MLPFPRPGNAPSRPDPIDHPKLDEKDRLSKIVNAGIQIVREIQARDKAWRDAVEAGEAVVVRRRAAAGPRFPRPHLEYQTTEEWKGNQGKRGQTLTDGTKWPRDIPSTWSPNRPREKYVE